MRSSLLALALVAFVGCDKPAPSASEPDRDAPSQPKRIAKEEKPKPSAEPSAEPLRPRQLVYLYDAKNPHRMVELFETIEARKQYLASVKEGDSLGMLEFVRAVPAGTSARVLSIAPGALFVEIRDGFRLGDHLLVGAVSYAHPEQAPELTDASTDAP